MHFPWYAELMGAAHCCHKDAERTAYGRLGGPFQFAEKGGGISQEPFPIRGVIMPFCHAVPYKHGYH